MWAAEHFRAGFACQVEMTLCMFITQVRAVNSCSVSLYMKISPTPPPSFLLSLARALSLSVSDSLQLSTAQVTHAISLKLPQTQTVNMHAETASTVTDPYREQFKSRGRVRKE